MRFLFSTVLHRSKQHHPTKVRSFRLYRLYSRDQRPPDDRSSFGIAFDIDGVLLRGNSPIDGATTALRRLYRPDGSLKFPFIFLTNGGGVPESKRALELCRQLRVQISPLQVVQGHSPFKNLVKRFENELIVAVGKGEPAGVMSEYGFKKAISIDEYSAYFEGIDPLAQFKTWEVKQASNGHASLENFPNGCNLLSDRVQGVFVVSDPIDWGRDIQVLCDILRTGGRPGYEIGHQPPLFFANDDLEYQSIFPSERLGMGAFRIAFESVFNRIHNNALEYTSFGKPHPSVFSNAELVLKQIMSKISCDDPNSHSEEQERLQFTTLYMIGDNPSVDIQGARKTGHPWFSILTRTGVFKGKGNDTEFPADLVVDTVEDAVEFILKKENS